LQKRRGGEGDLLSPTRSQVLCEDGSDVSLRHREGRGPVHKRDEKKTKRKKRKKRKGGYFPCDIRKKRHRKREGSLPTPMKKENEKKLIVDVQVKGFNFHQDLALLLLPNKGPLSPVFTFRKRAQRTWGSHELRGKDQYCKKE